MNMKLKKPGFHKKVELPYLPLQQLDHLINALQTPGSILYAIRLLKDKLKFITGR